MFPVSHALGKLDARDYSDTHSDESLYSYTPSEAYCIAYVVVFSLIGIAHCFQAYRARLWIVFPTLVAGVVTELLGWSARLWSSQNVLLLTPFLMQISTLIIAPVFFSAFDYTMFGAAIASLGAQYSFFQPLHYLAIFLMADIISLILQAVGGGQAASAASSSSPTKQATNIMLAGIIFQLCSMVIFLALVFDFVYRYKTNRVYRFQVARLQREYDRAQQGLPEGERTWWGAKRQDGIAPTSNPSSVGEQASRHTIAPQKQAHIVERNNSDDSNATQVNSARFGPKTSESNAMCEEVNTARWWILLGAIVLSSLMIICRGFYRSVELEQGWDGALIQAERYQNWLDGFVMILAVAVFNFAHPLFLFGRKASWNGYH